MKKAFYFIGLLLWMASCRPAKKVQRIESAISKKDTAEAVIVKPPKTVDSFELVKDIVYNLNKNRINFTTFSAKVRVEYEGKDNSNQANAYIRIQKDSLIWVSLTGALGIEGYRALITRDSVMLMNKLDKTIQYRSISYLQDITKVPFDFYALQDFIVGNPIFLDSNIVSFKSANDQLLVSMVGTVFKNLITIDNQSLNIVHSKLDDINPLKNRTADITYDDYEKQDSINFSTKRKITVSEKSKLDINLDFKNYNFNKLQDYPFNIPKNYKVR